MNHLVSLSVSSACLCFSIKKQEQQKFGLRILLFRVMPTKLLLVGLPSNRQSSSQSSTGHGQSIIAYRYHWLVPHHTPWYRVIFTNFTLENSHNNRSFRKGRKPCLNIYIPYNKCYHCHRHRRNIIFFSSTRSTAISSALAVSVVVVGAALATTSESWTTTRQMTKDWWWEWRRRRWWCFERTWRRGEGGGKRRGRNRIRNWSKALTARLTWLQHHCLCLRS